MSEEAKHVIVTDIRMSFLSMVVFMVKWVIASIPALFILGFLAICVAMISRILFP